MAGVQLSWIDDHPVAAFFIGACAYTWIVSAPAVFMEPSWTAMILIYIGSFGPPISAAVVTWLRGEDVRAWARQITDWRVSWYWWAVALGLPIALAIVNTGFLAAIGGPVDLDQALVSPGIFAVIFLFGLTVSGGLNEEPGWRGFAQARLNEQYGAFNASLIVGVVWAIWHVPYFFAPVTPHSGFTLINQIGWIAGILTLSVILAWAYNSTGSVLIVMVLHAMANTADVIVPLAPDQIIVDGIIDEYAVGVVVATHVLIYVLVVAVIVAYYGREKLAHGNIPDASHVGGGHR